MPRLDQEGFPARPLPILTQGAYTSPNPSLLYQESIPTPTHPYQEGIATPTHPYQEGTTYPNVHPASVVISILTHPDQEGIPPIPVVWVGGVGWGGRKTRGGGEMISVAAAPTQSSPGRYPSYHPILTKGLILFLRLLAKEISSSPQ